ncbi:MAG: CAP domain-containing protein [Candidatus Staskawiczbacteria bacterium]
MNYSVNEDIIERLFDKAKELILPSESNGYRSKFLQSKLLLCCVIFLFVLKLGTTLIAINFPQNIFFADITKATLENLVNQTREAIGLKPLAENNKLNQAAELKAKNMVQNNYFEHVSPTGVTPWFWFRQVGYKYKYAGENLAIGFYESEEVYNAWLNSPSHRANIVSPNYTEVGTAILKGFGQGNAIIVVQEFGSQILAKPITTNTNIEKQPAEVKKEIVKSDITKTTPENSKTVNNETVKIANNSEKVLSETTDSTSYINVPIETGLNNISSKIINSVVYNHDVLIQNVIYGVSFVIIGILLTLILFNFNISFKNQLVYRSVLIIVLLSIATLLDKNTIIALIPHQMFI